MRHHVGLWVHKVEKVAGGVGVVQQQLAIGCGKWRARQLSDDHGW